MNPIVNGRPQPLGRSALYAVLDQYLAALKGRDPSRVRWSARVYNTENNVALMVGDGLWGTITGLGTYDLRFCDEAGRQVGWFGTVDETDENSAIALRLKVDAEGAIAEVETLVVRQADSGLKFEPQRFVPRDVELAALDARHRALVALQRPPLHFLAGVVDRQVRVGLEEPHLDSVVDEVEDIRVVPVGRQQDPRSRRPEDPRALLRAPTGDGGSDSQESRE